MTILGKMLTILVAVLSLFWIGLSVNAFVTRTNWANEAKANADIAKAAIDSGNYQRKLAESTRDLANAQLLAMRQELARMNTQMETFRSESVKSKQDLANKLAVDQNTEPKDALLQTNVAKLEKQVELLQARLSELEKQANDAVIAREVALAEKVKAELAMKAAIGRADDLEIRFLRVQDRLNEAVNGGRGNPASLAPPEDFKATVTSVAGDLVSINLGANAKLMKGARLDISRTSPAPKFIGYLEITSVDPYGAVGRFIPRAGVARPGPDDMPKRGDTVGVVK
jgi:hypothetical protein